MGNADEIPENVIAATLAFLNAGGTDELRKIVTSNGALLLTDPADRVIEGLIEQHRDSKDDLSHLRGRRAILLRCREYGVQEAFSKPRRGDVDATVMKFINTRDTGELMRIVREHEQVLLAGETDAIIRDLAFLYKDDQQIQQFLADRRDLLARCRRYGIKKAFSDNIIEVPSHVADALGAFIMGHSIEDVRRVLHEKHDILLTDDAEQALAFMAGAVTDAGDKHAALMRVRLDLLRRCRAAGIDEAIDAAYAYFPASPTKVRNDNAPAQSAGNPGLDQELLKLADANGAISGEELENLLQRRPELADELRNRLTQGDILWAPGGDRSAMERVIEANRVAEATGRWSDLIPIVTDALRRTSRDSSPGMWAMLQESLGTALSRTPHGDRAENLDRAIEHHELARQVFKSSGEGPERGIWAMNEHHLALAYFQRVRGDRTENIEKAIRIWRNLIGTIPDGKAPLEWTTGLADALRQRGAGHRARNVEEAIEVLHDTVARADAAGVAESGSNVSIVLGLSYMNRVEGDPADNAEQAIHYLTQGLKEANFETDITSLSNVRRSLAQAYRVRQFGDPNTNWQTALDILAQIVESCPKERYPEQWAETQLAIAGMQRDNRAGARLQDALESVRISESVFDVYTLQDYPYLWAKVHLNIASTYAALIAGAHPDEQYFAKAAAHVENAFRVYTREAAPDRWALLHRTLGKLNVRRAELAEPEARLPFVRKAVDHFERALEAAQVADDPQEILQVLQYLSMLHFRQQEWQKSVRRCVEAMRASDRLLAATHTESGEMQRVSATDWIYGPAAYCLFQVNDPKASLVCLEWGKSRILARGLTLRDLDIAHLPEAEFSRINSLRRQVRTLQSEFRGRKDEATSLAALSRSLGDATRNLDRVVAESERAGNGIKRSRLRVDEIFEAVSSPGALIVPLITGEGTVVFVLLRGERGDLELVHVSLGWLTRELVRQLLVGTSEKPGWLRQYRASKETDAWRHTIGPALASMWSFMFKGLVDVLDGRLPSGAPVTIVPAGELAFFPFHVASEQGDGRGSLLEHFPVAYAPSIYALRSSQRRIAQRPKSPVRFVAAVNPTGDLRYTEQETDVIEDVIAPEAREFFRRDRATVDNMRGAVNQATHLHFACHGLFNAVDVMKSGLVLAGGPMTIEQIMGPDFEMTAARLVTLSACETGLIDMTHAPDEFIGLPAALLQGGACGVVSTLWPVPDRATSLLMRRFYEAHLVRSIAPAEALRQAQLWLRDASREEIGDSYRNRKHVDDDASTAYFELMLDGAPDDRPYQDPYYWAAFQFTGA